MVVRFARHFSFVSMHSSALSALECIVGHGSTSDVETGDVETGDVETGDVGTGKHGKLRNSGNLRY